MCDIRILLDIPYEVRKQRAMLRDNITEEAFLLRDKSSISYNNEDFDVVLKTNNKEEVERKVKLR
jgi:dephospho-CoA kinase